MSGIAIEMQLTANLRSQCIFLRDACEAARITIAQAPVPRDLVETLAPLLRDLIASDRISGQCVASVSLDQGVHRREIFAFGLSGFVGDACAEKLMVDPPPNFALDILQRCRRGERACSLLDAPAIARANAGDGLNLVPLCWLQRPCDTASPLAGELATLGMESFFSRHRGYNLKRIVKVTSAEDHGSEVGLTRGLRLFCLDCWV